MIGPRPTPPTVKKSGIPLPMPKSIRARLVILVLLVLVPPAAIIVYTGFETRRHGIEDAERDALRVAHGFVNLQTSLMTGVEQTCGTLARLPEVRNLDAGRCNAIFADILHQNPLYNNIVLSSPDGTVVASGATPTKLGYTIADRRHFKEAFRAKGAAVGEFIIARSTGRPVIPTGYLVNDKNGVPLGVIVLLVGLDQYATLMSEAKLPKGSELSICDWQGIRLLHYPPLDRAKTGQRILEKIWRRMSAPIGERMFVDKGLDNIERVYASVPLHLKESATPYCYIRVGIPTSEALAPANAQLARSFFWLAIGGGVAALSAWLYGNAAITRRLRRLLDAVRRMREEGGYARTGIPHEEGEIGELAQGFDMLAAELEREERELRDSEERFRRLAENAPDIVYRMELATGRYEYVNPSVVQITGYTQEEYYANPLLTRRMIHPDWINFFDEQWGKLLTGEDVPRSYEYPIIHKSGEERWLRQSNVLVWGDDGKPQCVEGIMADVTGRRNAEKALKEAMAQVEYSLENLKESEERYRELFENMPQGVIYFDGEGKIMSANPAAERILGRPLGPMKGVAVTNAGWEFVNEDEKPIPVPDRPVMKAIRTGQAVRGMILGVFTPRYDERRWLAVSVTPRFKLDSAVPFQVFATFEDITELRLARQRAEEATRRLAMAGGPEAAK